MKQLVIITALFFASLTTVAQNGSNTVVLNNSNEQNKEQTTTKEAEAQKEIKTEENKEVSIFDNNILHPELVAKTDSKKEDK